MNIEGLYSSTATTLRSTFNATSKATLNVGNVVGNQILYSILLNCVATTVRTLPGSAHRCRSDPTRCNTAIADPTRRSTGRDSAISAILAHVITHAIMSDGTVTTSMTVLSLLLLTVLTDVRVFALTVLLDVLDVLHTVAMSVLALATRLARPLPRRHLKTAVRASSSGPSSRPHFPCVDAHAARQSRLMTSPSPISSPSPTQSGPEPPYARPSPKSYNIYHHSKPFPLTYAPPLPSLDIAYETWGTLSPSADNVILLHTGLSASSHAASTPANPSEGWWEKFIGPGKALDTNQFFIICTNVLGGCYGTTGPSSIEPATGLPYATRFPLISIFDMVQAQFCLLDHLGIQKLYASVGCSMGAMQSLAAGFLYPEHVGKVVSISGTARSTPSSIAMRFAQRSGMYHFFSQGFTFSQHFE